MTNSDTNRRRSGVGSCCKAARIFCKDSARIPARIYQHLAQCVASEKHRLVGYDPLVNATSIKAGVWSNLLTGSRKSKTPTCKAYANFDPARILAGWGSA